AGHDDVQRFQFIDAVGVFQYRDVLAHIRAGFADLRGGEKDRLDVAEIILGAHALHQHGTHHATPADKTDSLAHYRILPCGAASASLPSDRKSTRLNSSHVKISYAVFCLKKKSYGDW